MRNGKISLNESWKSVIYTYRSVKEIQYMIYYIKPVVGHEIPKKSIGRLLIIKVF